MVWIKGAFSILESGVLSGLGHMWTFLSISLPVNVKPERSMVNYDIVCFNEHGLMSS
jgi:hypothetical protein